QTLKTLADYRQAEEFAHFGSELVAESKHALATGKRILRILTQGPAETFSLMAQQLMLDLILNLGDGEDLDLEGLKAHANEFGAKVTKEEEYEKVREELKAQCVIQLRPAQAAAADKKAQPEPAPAEAKK
ncbi:MAG TPA: hypothetical protein VN554_02285, partial [Verrucomicrobiae bacterium]|nr:hypothetical protein [Verrucomicrobiae bacterium]